MDFILRDISILDTLLAWLNSLCDKIRHHVLKLGFGDFDVKMLRSRGIGGDKWQRHISLSKSIKFTLGLLRSLTQTLHRKVIARQINSGILFELFHQELEQFFIEIFSSKHGVTVGSLDFEHTS
mmetsp:Transcript_27626/g.39554  ORF Transcript_27626/g.39554 Transcript_27626/m.39554 type:complete len:124 (-) Transcript_27626:787-1158(-)